MTTRDEARAIFKLHNLTYEDLSRKNLQRLRNIINGHMIESCYMNDTLRCNKTVQFRPNKDKFWAGIKCKSFYFTGREVVSFNRDGFIGFAGWADDKHIQPILDGFIEWTQEQANP